MNLIMSCVKFRRACKRLEPLNAPDWIITLGAIADLDHALETFLERTTRL